MIVNAYERLKIGKLSNTPWLYLVDENSKEIPEGDEPELLAGLRCFKLFWRDYK